VKHALLAFILVACLGILALQNRTIDILRQPKEITMKNRYELIRPGQDMQQIVKGDDETGFHWRERLYAAMEAPLGKVMCWMVGENKVTLKMFPDPGETEEHFCTRFDAEVEAFEEENPTAVPCE